MASRRDELNAYTFAKRRTLASFVQPSPSGSEEGAPRPLRAVLPGTIMGVVILMVFGGIGLFKPTAPKGWDATATNVIVASDSTTRYVVLKTGKQKQLHPVLNMASAKLLLKDRTDKVVTVDEGVLDNGDLPHGATLGIPYAPDRLPDAKEAEAAKRWMVCERPSDGGRAIQKAAFVFARKDWKKTEGRNQLKGGQLMYVADSVTKKQYVVDAKGTAHEIADPAQTEVLTALDTQQRPPQRVSSEWLKTLHPGAPITMPVVPGTPGQAANAVVGSGNAKYDKVGTVLKSLDGTKTQYYVVLQNKVARISEFTSRLLLNSKRLVDVNPSGQASQVSPASVANAVAFDGESAGWPTLQPETVNDGTSATSGRNTACNVLREVGGADGTTLSTWVGTDFPQALPTGSSSAYVTPGSGQVFRQIQGTATKVGQIFLVTDTGLRYALQSNGDSTSSDKSVGMSDKERKELEKETQTTQKLLGYDQVTPRPIPLTWSTFLPTGPRLSKPDAGQPQGS
ncbi:type VII secretion protein EccB [Streptomyces sp. NPDC006552]|uniref:type VII secretion protein EccB n=1 Tax=Streptomyces sp. NPDC006552 TaxID=3157179 RepID=UPI0033A07DE8